MRTSIALLLVASLASTAIAGVDPPPASNVLYGFYFSNFTLTAASPGPNYYVIGDVFIQPGVRMTVEPGVTVLFSANFDSLNGGDYFNDSEIICEGEIRSIGTESDSIIFTSDSATHLGATGVKSSCLDPERASLSTHRSPTVTTELAHL